MPIEVKIIETHPKHGIVATANVSISDYNIEIATVQLIRNKVTNAFKVIFPKGLGKKINNAVIKDPDTVDKITDAIAATYMKRVRKHAKQDDISAIDSMFRRQTDRKHGKELRSKIRQFYTNKA